MMDNYIVTISREFGSGGRIIGKKVAEKLNIPCYDKSVSEFCAETSGISREFIENAEEQSPRFNMLFYPNTTFPSLQEQVFLAQSDTIKQLAQHGSCVIVGRCANYVLREHKNCINVFIYAPIEDRIDRVKNEYGAKVQEDIRASIIKKDKARANYYNFYADKKWGKSQSYDLCINSSLGIDLAVKIILETVNSINLKKE